MTGCLTFPLTFHRQPKKEDKLRAVSPSSSSQCHLWHDAIKSHHEFGL